MLDVVSALERFAKRGVRIVILNFANGEALDLTGTVQRFFVQIMAAVAEFEGSMISDRTREAMAYRRRAGLVNSKSVSFGRKVVIYDATGNAVPGAKLVKDPSIRRRVCVDADGHIIPSGLAKAEWDDRQLEYIAEIAVRTLVDGESMRNVKQSFRQKGILDNRGLPFGQRGSSSATSNAFVEARKWFINAGLAGELPNEWNAVAKRIAPPNWGVSKATASLRKAWAALAAKRAAKNPRPAPENDRSEWTLEDYQAWDAANRATAVSS